MAVQFTYVPIATQTISSSVSTITFSSIPSGYQDLIIAQTGTLTSGGAAGMIQFNGDTGSNYSVTYLYGDGSAGYSGRNTNQTTMQVGNTNSSQSSNLFHIMNYANTTTYKTVLNRANNNGSVQAIVGLWRSTAAITSITIGTNSGSLAVNTIYTIYGLAAA